MEDKKDAILKELETMKNKETISKQFFKVRAYRKVIDQISSLPRVISIEDLENVSGIGVKIRAKIEEILKTGKLKAAERAKEKIPEMSIYNQLLQITGIGIVKANQLIEMGIKSIEDLRSAVQKNPEILTPAQKNGLKYHQDISLKIPRRETQRHLRKISKVIKEINGLMIKVVGSYRRGTTESSDIDLILTTKKNTNGSDLSQILENVIDKLKEIGYLVADISHGTKKYMGIAKISKRSPVRRIDILVTSIEEYPFALIYFTGDFDINIQLRKRATEIGYRLNEYGLTSLKSGTVIPKLASERQIFNFLGYRYLQPKMRKINNLVELQ